MIIEKRIPVSRSQEIIEYDQGKLAALCYAPHNPHYFKTNSGKYKKIELFPENVKGKMDISLWDKNVTSMGLKRNGDGQKYIGYRPDVDQSGAEQLEFTLVSVKLDREDQKIETGEPSRVDTCAQSVGSKIVVINNRQGSKQCWRVERPIRDFEIKYKLNLTGLTVKPIREEFWFYSIKTGEFRFRIKLPSVLDAKFNRIPVDGLAHTLVKESGDLIYKKKNLQPLDIKDDVYYLDAETCYSSTEDGYCELVMSEVAEPTYLWNAAQEYTTATSTNSTGELNTYSRIFVNDGWAPVCEATIRRSFLMFDTSSLSAAPDSGTSLFIKSDSSGGDRDGMSAQKGTQGDTIEAGDYDAFSGSSYGSTDGWSTAGGWNEIAFNAQGMADIVLGGTTLVCCRGYENDYLDVMPALGTYHECSGYSTDASGTANDPYLLITLGWRQKIYGTSLYKKILNIDRENIQSVMGVESS